MKVMVEGDFSIYPPEEDPEIYPNEQIWEIKLVDSVADVSIFEEIFYCPFCGKKLK